MSQQSQDWGDILLRKLESVAELETSDQAEIRELPIQAALLNKDHDIVREGDKPTRSCILLTGITCWTKTTDDGKRQIMSLGVPGDVPDFQSLNLQVMDSTLTTLTSCEVGFVPHDALRALCGRNPRIAQAFWTVTLVEGAIYREWVVNVGSRPAIKRIAHLLCEFMVRMRAVGLANGNSCSFPLTQDELGQATGLSDRPRQPVVASVTEGWTDPAARRIASNRPMGGACGIGRLRSNLPAYQDAGGK